MSHLKVFGGIMESHEFLCDGEGCDESYEDAGSFVEVLDKAKSKGWTVTKDRAGNWCHYCPDCMEGDDQ